VYVRSPRQRKKADNFGLTEPIRWIAEHRNRGDMSARWPAEVARNQTHRPQVQ